MLVFKIFAPDVLSSPKANEEARISLLKILIFNSRISPSAKWCGCTKNKRNVWKIMKII
jgi:hypothetical protein